MKGYYISRLQSGKQNHYECCGIRDLLREQVTSQLWGELEKSPKGGVGGSEIVANQPSGSSVQVDNSARKWEARSIQLPRGTPEESRWRICGRLLPLHPVVGPESLCVSRASSWEQELAAARSTRPDGIYRQPVSVSHCVTRHYLQSGVAAASLLSSKSHANLSFTHLWPTSIQAVISWKTVPAYRVNPVKTTINV